MERWYPAVWAPQIGRLNPCVGLVLVAAVVGAACTEVPLDRARRLSKAGRHLEAGESYLAAARAHPALLAAWDGAIDAFCTKEVRIGRCLDVLDLELSLLGPVPRHQEVLSAALEHRARLRLERGLVDAALADLERAERAGPRRATVFTARARALVARGEHTEAERAVLRALELDPDLEGARELTLELSTAAPDDAPENRFGGPRGSQFDRAVSPPGPAVPRPGRYPPPEEPPDRGASP